MDKKTPTFSAFREKREVFNNENSCAARELNCVFKKLQITVLKYFTTILNYAKIKLT